MGRWCVKRASRAVPSGNGVPQATEQTPSRREWRTGSVAWSAPGRPPPGPAGPFRSARPWDPRWVRSPAPAAPSDRAAWFPPSRAPAGSHRCGQPEAPAALRGGSPPESHSARPVGLVGSGRSASVYWTPRCCWRECPTATTCRCRWYCRAGTGVSVGAGWHPLRSDGTCGLGKRGSARQPGQQGERQCPAGERQCQVTHAVSPRSWPSFHWLGIVAPQLWCAPSPYDKLVNVSASDDETTAIGQGIRGSSARLRM